MKNKKKIRFNLIDVIVLILIVTTVAVTAYLFIQGKGIFKKNSAEIEYTLKIDQIPTEFVKNISAGDEIFDQNSSFSLGVVNDVIIENPGKRYPSMSLYITADAERENDFIFVNGVALYDGAVIDFYTPELMYTGVCGEIKIKGDDGK